MEQDVQDAAGNAEAVSPEDLPVGQSTDSRPDATQDVTAEDNSGTSSEAKPGNETGEAFAAVKKEFRNKGRNEGFQTGYEQAKQELLSQYPQLQQQPGDPQANAQQPVGQTPPGYGYAPQQQPSAPQAHPVDVAGIQKYQDKWEATVDPLVQEARWNPDMYQVLAMAQGLPNAEEIIYKLGSDESAREQLLDKNPKRWQQELIKLSAPTPAAQPPKVVKVANPPVETLKAPPVSGGGKKTTAQRIAEKKVRRVRGLA